MVENGFFKKAYRQLMTMMDGNGLLKYQFIWIPVSAKGKPRLAQQKKRK
jgi:hypothetical protein